MHECTHVDSFRKVPIVMLSTSIHGNESHVSVYINNMPLSGRVPNLDVSC